MSLRPHRWRQSWGFENCWECQNHSCGEMGLLGEISPPRPLPAAPTTTPPHIPRAEHPYAGEAVQVNLPWLQRSY